MIIGILFGGGRSPRSSGDHGLPAGVWPESHTHPHWRQPVFRIVCVCLCVCVCVCVCTSAHACMRASKGRSSLSLPSLVSLSLSFSLSLSSFCLCVHPSAERGVCQAGSSVVPAGCSDKRPQLSQTSPLNNALPRTTLSCLSHSPLTGEHSNFHRHTHIHCLAILLSTPHCLYSLHNSASVCCCCRAPGVSDMVLGGERVLRILTASQCLEPHGIAREITHYNSKQTRMTKKEKEKLWQHGLEHMVWNTSVKLCVPTVTDGWASVVEGQWLCWCRLQRTGEGGREEEWGQQRTC